MTKRRISAEVALVLALSLGASAVYSIVAILDRVTRDAALSEQTATINRALNDREIFDFTYQILGFLFGLAPVALVVFLLWKSKPPHLGSLGLKTVSWGKETLFGVALAAAIGIPGIAFYLITKALGLNTTVVPNALDPVWWGVPVLILLALKAALVEEVIVVGYLFNRLKLLGFSPLWIIAVSSLLRGTYHLYQGFGGFLGNIIMGVVFAWVFYRWGKLLPLIVAHWVLDIVSFAGYPLAKSLFHDFF